MANESLKCWLQLRDNLKRMMSRNPGMVNNSSPNLQFQKMRHDSPVIFCHYNTNKSVNLLHASDTEGQHPS